MPCSGCWPGTASPMRRGERGKIREGHGEGRGFGGGDQGAQQRQAGPLRADRRHVEDRGERRCVLCRGGNCRSFFQPEGGDQERAWDAFCVSGFRRICRGEERLPDPQRRQPGGWSEGPGHETGELSSRRGRSLPPAGDGGGEAQSPEAGGALPGEGYRERRREVLRRCLCQRGRRAGGGRRKAQHRGRQLCPAGTAPGGGGCPAALF